MKKILFFSSIFMIFFSACGSRYILKAPNNKSYFIDNSSSCKKFKLDGDILHCYDLDKKVDKKFYPIIFTK